MTDKIMEEDIKILADSVDWEPFRNTTVMVTGASGLIGSQIVKAFLLADAKYSLSCTVLAVVRNRAKAESLFSGYGTPELLVQDICQPLSCDKPVDYIIHCASATGSKDFVEHPVDVIRTGLHGTENVLEFARGCQLKSMVFLSSMEVYGNPDETAGKIGESDYAYFDHLKVRSSYPESKKMIECMCVAYAAQYQVPVKIARLTQTFGAGVLYQDGRVFAEFARCVLENKDIVLHTKGETVRNYCYVTDAVRAILTILIKGTTAEAVNVANTATTCSISQMAQMVADLAPEFGSRIEVKYEIAQDLNAFGYAPKLIMDLDTSKLEALGWKAAYDLPEMFTRTIKSMRARK